MKKVQVIMNEQHQLLPDQERLLNERFGDSWEVFPVPADGWSRKEQSGVAYELLNHAEVVVFASPIPYLLKELSFSAGLKVHPESGIEYGKPFSVFVLHNDRREKKELPDGRIVSVVAKEGWQLV